MGVSGIPSLCVAKRDQRWVCPKVGGVRYPQRARRPVQTLAANRVQQSDKSSDATASQLDVILERLQEIEKNTNDGRSSKFHPPSTHFSPIGLDSAPNFACGPTGTDSLPCTGSVSSPSSLQEDAIKPLKTALDQVQSLRVQTINRLSLEEPLRLPCDVAKSWIESTLDLDPMNIIKDEALTAASFLRGSTS